MIEKFLNAKHWQLFILMIGIPIIIEIILLMNMFSEASYGNKPNLNFLMVFPFIMIIFTGMLFGWFWSIVIGFQSKIPKGVKMKVKKFKILFFIPLVYILLFNLFLMGNFYGLNFPDTIIGFLMPLHLFSMFCIFYCMYFVSKTIKTVELQREVDFGDYAGEFFLLWFYMIGIWFIQPKINRLSNTDFSKIKN